MAIRPYNRINIVIFYCGVREGGICSPFIPTACPYILSANIRHIRYLSGNEGNAEEGERDGPLVAFLPLRKMLKFINRKPTTENSGNVLTYRQG